MTGKLVVAALTATLAAGACTRASAPPPARSCCVQIAARIDARFDERERREIERAMQSWIEATGGRVCMWPTTSEHVSLVIVRADSQDDIAAFVRDAFDHVGVYYSGIIALRPDAVPASDMHPLAAHEIGHALGLEHNDRAPESVMAPHLHGALDAGAIPYVDVAAFERAHAECR